MVATAEWVDNIATELFRGVDTAVECWLAQIEEAATNQKLTTLGRMNAVQEILDRYKNLTGKAELHCRQA